MKKFNLNKNAVGNFMRAGCKVVGCALVLVLPQLCKKETLDMVRYSGDVNYSDAVEAIMSSGMFSSDKRAVINFLQKDHDSELYKSVIKIANSNMFSSDKVKTIESICKSNS